MIHASHAAPFGMPVLSTDKNAQFMIERESTRSEKVVIQFGTRTVKGYLESPAWNTIEELLSGAPLSSPETLRVRLLESDTVEEISIKDVKAIFYVHSFDGDAKHKEMSFYGNSPIVHGIWMRVQFLDGEVDGGNRTQLHSLSG